MGKNLLVVTLTERGISSEDILQKGVAECREKTFKEVFEYMLDPREDSINPEYSPDEKRICSRIKSLVDGKSKNEQILLRYIDSKKRTFLVDLNKEVGEYPDAILDKEAVENGEKIPYKGLDLEMEIDAIGGRTRSDFRF